MRADREPIKERAENEGRQAKRDPTTKRRKTPNNRVQWLLLGAPGGAQRGPKGPTGGLPETTGCHQRSDQRPPFRESLQKLTKSTLCRAILLPCRKSAFRAVFEPDCYRESTEVGPPAGRGPAGGTILMFPGSSPAKIRPGSPIYGPEALLPNIESHKHKD